MALERGSSFTSEHLGVLQGFVNGLSEEGIARQMGVGVEQIQIFMRQIGHDTNEPYSRRGISLAIFQGVLEGSIRTDRLPDTPIENLNEDDIKVWARLIQGLSNTEISGLGFNSTRGDVIRKLGVGTNARAVALGAREIKRKLNGKK